MTEVLSARSNDGRCFTVSYKLLPAAEYAKEVAEKLAITSSLVKCLSRVLDAGSYADIVIKVDEREFKAHKVVLAGKRNFACKFRVCL